MSDDSIKMTLSQRIADLLDIIHGSLDNMFIVPVDNTIFEFSTTWLSVPTPSSVKDLLTNKSAMQLVTLHAIETRENVVFEMDAEDTSDNELSDINYKNTLHQYEWPYSYGDLFVSFYYAINQLASLVNKIPSDEGCKLINHACNVSLHAYNAFVPAVAKQQPITAHNMQLIAQTVTSWAAVIEFFAEED